MIQSKVFDSDTSSRWSGRNFIQNKSGLILLKNGSVNQDIVLPQGEYEIKIIAKKRIGDAEIILSITDKDSSIFTEEACYNATVFTELKYKFQVTTPGTYFFQMKRKPASVGSMEVGRIVIYEDKETAIKREKKSTIISSAPQIDRKKKIGIVIPYKIYGGAEVYIKTLLDGYAYGHSITLIYLNANPMQSIINSSLIEHKSVRGSEALINHLHQSNYDVIIYYNSIAAYNTILTAIKTKKLRSKLVEIYHSDFKWADSLSSLQSRDSLSCMFSVSEAIGKHINFEKIHLPVPINLTKFSALKPAANKRGYALTVGTVARLSKEKNIDYILDLALASKDIHYMVAGEGPDLNRLKQRISSEKIHNVSLLGFQANISSFLSSIDVFVLPSLMEGTPISILEAMASKKAVIANNVGGVSSILNDQCGRYLTLNIAKDLSLIRDKNIDEMTFNAYKYVQENHNLVDVRQKLFDEIDELLKKEYEEIPDALILYGEYV